MAFEIIVDRSSSAALSAPLLPLATVGLERPDPEPRALHFVIEADSVRALLRDRLGGASVLRDLAFALRELATIPLGKRIVRFYEEAWELCIERAHDTAWLSVYRTGAEPMVLMYDRPMPFGDVVAGVRDALTEAASHDQGLEMDLADVRTHLDALRFADRGPLAQRPVRGVTVVGDPEGALSFGAQFNFHGSTSQGDEESAVERADLHVLLFAGDIHVSVRGREARLGSGHPFVFAEALLRLLRAMLDAWQKGAPLHAKVESGRASLAVRMSERGVVHFAIGGKGNEAACTFPNLVIGDFGEAVIHFARALVRALLRHDRAQGRNLRLSAFRRTIRELGESMREATAEEQKLNLAPDAYRSFLERAPVSGVRRALPALPLPARLRYDQKWRALVPGIDLRGTFLCGQRLVVGSAAETFCLDRATGEVMWRVNTQRATSFVTPGGIARITGEGVFTLHDFGDGDITLRGKLLPRRGRTMAGLAVSGPGLPRLLLVSEGEHHLVALDLLSGEPRWRFNWGRGGHPRLRRAGKLVYIVTGGSSLSALDVTTGSIVWQRRDRLRFDLLPAFDRDALFAVSGGQNSMARLHHIDSCSGELRWSIDLGRTTVPSAPLVSGDKVIVPLRMREGVVLHALDRTTGAVIWKSLPSPSETAWLAVDDLLVGNTPLGELVGIESQTGALRYRHALGQVIEVDVPRRLEPVLRSGALFVPHVDVHVFRPSDGAKLGVVGPCEAIPDLLRVDERCDVYVAEESGHLVSFSAGPMLRVV